MSLVTITESAKKYLDEITSDHGTNYVRLAVDGGGCSGFQYKWEFEETPFDDDNIIDIQDGCALLIDQTSEMYVLGSKIDYVKELGGSFLKVENPLVNAACGCGESFSINPQALNIDDPFA